LAGEGLGRAFTAIAFIHLARILQPAVYGQVELTLAVMMLLTVVVDLGLGPLGAREIARRPGLTGLLVEKIVTLQLVLAVALLSLIFLITTTLLLDSTLTRLLQGYGVTLLAFPFLLNWVFQGWSRMGWVAAPQVLRQVVFALFVLWIIRRPDQVTWIILVELLSVSAAAGLNVLLYLRSGHPFKIDLRHITDSELLTSSLPIAGSQLIWALRMYLPIIVLGLLAGKVAAGLFGAPHRIVMVLQGLLAVYFTNIFPLMSQVSNTSTTRFTRLIRRSIQVVLWPALLLALITTFSAPILIQWIFGAGYMQPEAITVLIILVWMIPVLAWRGHNRNALIALNRQGEELVSSLVAIILLVGLFYPLITGFGAIGAAWAMLAAELIGAALTGWRLKRHLPELGFFPQLFRLRPQGSQVNPQETA
jgi:O-antigen/teichoic acid export membrane protein